MEEQSETSPLLRNGDTEGQHGIQNDGKKEGYSSVGERLPYNDYTSIDWLHDLVKDSYRIRALRTKSGIRSRLLLAWDSGQGWVAVAIIGILTALVAFLVDIAVAVMSDWKLGYCTSNILSTRETCCAKIDLGPGVIALEDCPSWHEWTPNYSLAFVIYTVLALCFGVLSASLTLLTRATVGGVTRQDDMDGTSLKVSDEGKVMFLAAGSGIPATEEIKTILSGFVIPGILSFKVLSIKAIGAVFAVSSGMCLGKEGPFVHISTCVAYQVAKFFPKYRNNGRKLREILSAGCSSGLAVAFGAPIGGVLFSYEEISTYFPRKVLWKAFLCSLFAAVILKELNPTGTGKLVLFETNFGTSYRILHYLVFIFLGILGGVFGGVFCKANYLWSKSFRSFRLIKEYPVFEVFLVVLATSLLQYPNPLSRDPGDIIIKNLLVDCNKPSNSIVCEMESAENKSQYIMWLVYGTTVKLVLTTITFGCKVPSGVIIPALDAGAFAGRLLGQAIGDISPGLLAMVGAAAFLAGVSRMTLSLAVVMFELTGELEYVVPNMIAILVAKWIADVMEPNGVYDLAQTVLGHPFLDPDHALVAAQQSGELAAVLIPPEQTMDEITVKLPSDFRVPRHILKEKFDLLVRRGITDAGLVLTYQSMLYGYLPQCELAFGLELPYNETSKVCLIGLAQDDDVDLSSYVDRTPLMISQTAPIEYVVEMFAKLGLVYLAIVDNSSGQLLGIVIRKRLMLWLQENRH